MQDWVLALASSPWVFLVLYLLATIDGFFPPVPSESAVIALAVLAVQPDGPSLPLLAVAAAAGALSGDLIAYTLGTKIKVRELGWLRGRRGQAALDWAEVALKNRGASFIIAARYVPVGRVAVNMTAGAVGLPRRRFVLLAGIAAVTWSCYSLAIGVSAGKVLDTHPLLGIGAGVVGGILLGLLLDQVMSALARRREQAEVAVPDAAGGPAGQ